MYRSTCELRGSKAPTLREPDEREKGPQSDNVSDGDSSKENSLIDEQNNLDSTSVLIKGAAGSPAVPRSPWGHTLMPRSRRGSYGDNIDENLSPDRMNMTSNSPLLSPSKSNVPWNDVSFAAEVLSPGFTGRVVRAAHASSPRSPREARRQYPTAQERYVRAGVLPNVRLGGRAKAVLTPRRTPASPLIPLSRSPSAFSSSLSSDFLSSATPRMPDIRSVASVLEPVSTGSECVRDPTSVQAVVAALQQAQAGKGVKRGSCYMEAEDLSKRQRCNTPCSSVSTPMPVNYSRDYVEDHQTHSNASSGNGGGEKRALDLSPSQGNSSQITPENKRRCVLDPMHASLSSSKFMDISRLHVGDRDTPFSLYDSRHDTDSESNRSVDSGQSKTSEQSVRQQTSEATGGDSCIVSPGPSERDLSDRSGSHTPQSTRGESWNSLGGVNGGTTNTSRTSTPRNPTPPHHNHIITLEAYKAEKTKSQQRLKKMLGMLFNVSETEETKSSTSGTSTPLPSVSVAKTTEITSLSSVSALPSSAIETSGSTEVVASSIVTKTPAAESSVVSSTIVPTTSVSESSNSEITSSYTFSLKPASSNCQRVTSEATEPKDPALDSKEEGSSNVSVSAVIKLPLVTVKDSSLPKISFGSTSSITEKDTGPQQAEMGKPSNVVDVLKNSSLPPTTSVSLLSNVLTSNPILQSKLAAPSQDPVKSIPVTSEPGWLGKISAANFTETALVEQKSKQKIETSVSSSSSLMPGILFSTSQTMPTIGSPFTFSSSSGTNILTSSNTAISSALSLPKASLPFTFGSSTSEAQPSSTPVLSTGVTTNVGSVFTTQSVKPPALLSSATSESSSNLVKSPAILSSTPESSFTFCNPVGSSINSVPQSSLFTFGLAYTSATPLNSAVTQSGTSTSKATISDPALNPVFSFGSSTQVTTSSLTAFSSSVPTASLFSFGVTPPSSSILNTGLTVANCTTTTSLSSTIMAPAIDTLSASSSKVLPSAGAAFTFGQPSASQSLAANTSSAFTFSSAAQPPGTSSIFSFSMTPQDRKTQTSQSSFASGASTSQNNSIATSSPFAFGTSATLAPTSTSAMISSPFTFGAPKTDNADAASKATSQPGFTFGSTSVASTNAFGPTSVATTNAFGPTSIATTNAFGPTSVATTNAFGATSVATTNAFSSIQAPSVTNAFGSSTITSTNPSSGFSFGTPSAPPGFSFGSGNKTTTTGTAPGLFTFGSSSNPNPKAPPFGAPSTTAPSPFSFVSSSTTTPAFGSNPLPSFGAQTTSSTTFGTSTPSFGSSSLGATSPFGTSSTFGTNPPPPFGAPTFAASSTGEKTNSAQNLFGSGNQSSAVQFGSPSNETSTTPSFGAPSNPNPVVPTFGSPAPASASSGSGFGSTPAAPFGSFGAPSTNPSTTGATSPFQFGQGASNPPTFGMGSSTTPGGAVFQFGSGSPSPFNAGTGIVSPFGGDSQNFFSAGTSSAARRAKTRQGRRHR